MQADHEPGPVILAGWLTVQFFGRDFEQGGCLYFECVLVAGILALGQCTSFTSVFTGISPKSCLSQHYPSVELGINHPFIYLPKYSSLLRFQYPSPISSPPPFYLAYSHGSPPRLSQIPIRALHRPLHLPETDHNTHLVIPRRQHDLLIRSCIKLI